MLSLMPDQWIWMKVLYIPTYKKGFVEIFQWHVSYVIHAPLDLEDGGSKLLWNLGNYLPIDMVSYVRRFDSSSTLLQGTAVSPDFLNFCSW